MLSVVDEPEDRYVLFLYRPGCQSGSQKQESFRTAKAAFDRKDEMAKAGWMGYVERVSNPTGPVRFGMNRKADREPCRA